MLGVNRKGDHPCPSLPIRGKNPDYPTSVVDIPQLRNPAPVRSVSVCDTEYALREFTLAPNVARGSRKKGAYQRRPLRFWILDGRFWIS